MSSPESLQLAFASALTASRADHDSLAVFRGSGDAVHERMRYYRGNQQATAHSVLANAYPVVQVLLGDEFFEGVCDMFRRAHPSHDPDLNRYGAEFADFLRTFAPVEPYPYLPDVARLEWLCHEAWYAVDEAPLTVLDLQAMSPQDIAGLPVTLTDCTWPFTSPWDVVTIWRAHQPDGPPLPRHPERSSVCLVVRPDWHVNVQCASAGEVVALAALMSRDAPLGDVLQHAATLDAQFNPAEALPRWLQAGVLRRAT